MAPPNRTDSKRPGGRHKGKEKTPNNMTCPKATLDKLKLTHSLLSLPAEVRNRIYYFTREHLDDDPLEHSKMPNPDYNPGEWGPDSSFKPYPALFRHTEKSFQRSLRRPLALAQTCKQIRAEYRPFWLKASRFTVRTEDLDKFISTFYPKREDFISAPKELYISDEHDMYSQPQEPLDVTCLILLHANRKDFVCKFRPREMLEHHRYSCPYKFCVPWECMHERGYKYYLGMMDYMAYTEAYMSFIMNSNESWIEDARNDTFTVRCSFDEESGNTKFHIHQKLTLDMSGDPVQHASALLQKWGTASLEYAEHMSFVFEFDIYQVAASAKRGPELSAHKVVEVPSKAGDDDSEWFMYTQHYL